MYEWPQHNFSLCGLEYHDYILVSRKPASESGMELRYAHIADFVLQAGRALVPYHICTSRTGLCPTGRAVHAHAGPGDVDVVVFTVTSPGTYQVVCPLHPDIKGTVVVF